MKAAFCVRAKCEEQHFVYGSQLRMGGIVHSESLRRVAERGTRGGPQVRTGVAPEERRSKTKARRDRERWSDSRAPRRRAAPGANLGHRATKGGEEGRCTM
ncbi:hypothetical protein NDU88_004263 [Pleurodeles waltl]|uniref:Uncharacterized protein n=1 Tax=Pleurodeles waltl TaxID=8319 RepID=A0AAV7V468_PLEWA|nr:hypothetical protein NDU88_004263 [Pleurodeles waltl]